MFRPSSPGLRPAAAGGRSRRGAGLDVKGTSVEPMLLEKVKEKMREALQSDESLSPEAIEKRIREWLPRYFQIFDAKDLLRPDIADIAAVLRSKGFKRAQVPGKGVLRRYWLNPHGRPPTLHQFGQQAIFYKDGRIRLVTFGDQFMQDTIISADGKRKKNRVYKLMH